MYRRAAQRVSQSEKRESTHIDKTVSTQSHTSPEAFQDALLGSVPEKDAEEQRLERLVLGGAEFLVEKLSASEKPLKKTKKRAAALNAEDRKPAWEDPDDMVEVRKVKKRDRKRKTVQEISGKEYTEKLKAQFEKVTSGTPKWALLPSEREQESDVDSDVDELLTRTGTHLVTSSALPPGVLEIKRCPDVNSDSPSKGKLTSVQFHQTAQVLLTGSTDQSLRLFQVDGKNNPKIQSVFLDNFPVLSARFSTDGEEVIMGSKHRNFYYYDMMAGKVVFVPKIKGLSENNMARLRVSPDGRFIVFLGSYGHIHLISSKTKEWIHTLKMNGSVEDIAFSADGSRMYSTGDDGMVYVWDMNSRQCLHNFFDDGCVHGTSIAASRDSQYLVCGSNTGVVNVYDMDTCLSSRSPRPARAIMNLTTSCTTATFGGSSEILALASNFEEKAVKLVHFPSLRVFSNYPEMNDTKIRIPWSMDFSPNCGFFCIGNHKGQALLYRLKHYSSY